MHCKKLQTCNSLKTITCKELQRGRLWIQIKFRFKGPVHPKKKRFYQLTWQNHDSPEVWLPVPLPVSSPLWAAEHQHSVVGHHGDATRLNTRKQEESGVWEPLFSQDETGSVNNSKISWSRCSRRIPIVLGGSQEPLPAANGSTSSLEVCTSCVSSGLRANHRAAGG